MLPRKPCGALKLARSDFIPVANCPSGFWAVIPCAEIPPCLSPFLSVLFSPLSSTSATACHGVPPCGHCLLQELQRGEAARQRERQGASYLVSD